MKTLRLCIFPAATAFLLAACGDDSGGSGLFGGPTITDFDEQRRILREIWNEGVEGGNDVRKEEIWAKHNGKNFIIEGEMMEIVAVPEEESYYVWVQPQEDIELVMTVPGFGRTEIGGLWVCVFAESSRSQIGSLNVGDPVRVRGRLGVMTKLQGEMVVRMPILDCRLEN